MPDDAAVGPLVLASRSPQRRAILEQLRIAFVVEPVDVVELDAGVAHEVVRANALAKARAGAAARPGETVLGVDTIVTWRGEIIGKPPSAAAAEATSNASLDAPTRSSAGSR
ncbi:MAG: nucleoside triphosphate pyrophosphatase [Solirubrobacteraceae bacterium]|nr:nucleoside triphosphate pyrophosphatase [Solirubrobacteraceae bacterium]